MTTKYAIIHKNLGETPLEALERYRLTQPEIAPGTPLTYAGRLDPMAEGEMIVLAGEECKNKNKYTNLDKEYEVEILFGISTDTGDILGIPKMDPGLLKLSRIKKSEDDNGKSFTEDISDAARYSKFVGSFMQTYPAYSSKTVNGEQLHALARKGTLPASEDMPEKQVEIKSLEFLGAEYTDAQVILGQIFGKIGLVKGDFRQSDIKGAWTKLAGGFAPGQVLGVSKIRVTCTSGTYMRSLAERIGRGFGTQACAYSIKRTKIFLYDNMLV